MLLCTGIWSHTTPTVCTLLRWFFHCAMFCPLYCPHFSIHPSCVVKRVWWRSFLVFVALHPALCFGRGRKLWPGLPHCKQAVAERHDRCPRAGPQQFRCSLEKLRGHPQLARRECAHSLPTVHRLLFWNLLPHQQHGFPTRACFS